MSSMNTDNHDRYTHIQRTGGVMRGWTRMDNSSPTDERRAESTERQRQFIAKVQETRNEKQAREVLGIPKGTLDGWKMRNPVFAASVKMALGGM